MCYTVEILIRHTAQVAPEPGVQLPRRTPILARVLLRTCFHGVLSEAIFVLQCQVSFELMNADIQGPNAAALTAMHSAQTTRGQDALCAVVRTSNAQLL